MTNIVDAENANPSGLRLVKSGTMKPHLDNGRLIVAVEGDSIDEITSPSARRLAYDSRLEHGWVNAGIEQIEGPFPVDDKGNIDVDPKSEGKKKIRVVFALTPGL